MAMTAPQEPAQAGVPSIANSFSHAAAAAAASMASIFPHQMLFHHSTCKGSLSSAVLPFRTIDCLPSQLEAEDVYGFIDESPPLLLQYTPVERIGAGLANLGNTCFLNSVLQCLTYTPPLAAHLQAGLHNMSCKMQGFCAMCALERHGREALSSNGRVVSPSYLVKNLRFISRSFQLWRQEDAHEYMRYLIEALQRCSSVELLGGGSFIKGVFGGRLRSQVKCTQCCHCSNKYDPFLDLSLEVARADSLHKALADFTAIEVLDGDNKYHCSKCKTKVRALKQFTIDNAPPILTVQLKRFSSYGGKIDKKVHFERDLDLKPFVTGAEDEELSYSLYAVLVHSGWSSHSGHYYCFVRTATDTWHAMDDSEVSQVSESTVLAQKAYILFYVRNVGSSVTFGSNHLQENLVNLATPPFCKMSDHYQESSENLEKADNRSTLSHSSNHIHVSNEDGVLTVAEQVLTRLKQHDDLRKSVSGEPQAKLHSPAVLVTDEGNCSPPASEVVNSLSTAEEMDASILNDFCENSWYRAVQAIDNSSLNINNSMETQAGEFLCVRQAADAHEKTCAREQSVCADDVTCEGDPNDDANSGLESDEVSTPESCCQQRRHSFFSVVSPALRTTGIETAGHHAFSILCMCAKYCFWSCFWPPL